MSKKTTKKAQAESAKKDEPAKASPEPKAPKAKPDKKPKKVSAIDAAARVMAEAKEPMNCQDLIKVMAEKGYWSSPGGKTPWATLYSALLREIATKGMDARFKKTERGKFSANS
jgi:hypothetical protein